MESSHPKEDRSRRRHWEWLLLLLALLISFACIFLSTWVSLNTWPDRVKASMLAGKEANYKHSDQEDAAFGSMNPEVAAEAATDAARLQLTPSAPGRSTPAGIALLPPTPLRLATPTPPSAAVTTIPSLTPAPTSALPTATQTLIPTNTPTSAPPLTDTPTLVPPTSTGTATVVPPTPTETATPVPPTPTETATPVPPTPTDTPEPTDTPRPPTATNTPTPTPTPTDTPVAPTILAIRPQAALLGSSVPVTITGSNFESGADAALGGTSLLDVTWTSGTVLTAVVPSTMPTGTYTLIVTNPGPTSPSDSLVNAFQVFTYTVALPIDCSTPNPDVANCNDAGGAPDNQYAGIFTPTGVITLDFGSPGITDGPGYDLVFYERAYAGGIQLDYITIEISTDGITWITLFSWDGVPGDVTGTNIDSYATDANGEAYNEFIPAYDLYPGVPGGLNTGIAIDVGVVGTGPFQYVRVTRPPGGDNEPAEVDAIVRLN
jgi:hypothetical protein